MDLFGSGHCCGCGAGTTITSAESPSLGLSAHVLHSRKAVVVPAPQSPPPPPSHRADRHVTGKGVFISKIFE